MQIDRQNFPTHKVIREKYIEQIKRFYEEDQGSKVEGYIQTECIPTIKLKCGLENYQNQAQYLSRFKKALQENLKQIPEEILFQIRISEDAREKLKQQQLQKVKDHNIQQVVIPFSLLITLQQELISSENCFEQFVGILIATGLRKRELLEFTQVTKSDKEDYIKLDRILKKRSPKNDCEECEHGQEANQEANQKHCQEANQEANQEPNQEPNQEANQKHCEENNQELFQEELVMERPCNYNSDFTILAIREVRRKFKDICVRRKIELLDEDKNLHKFFREMINQVIRNKIPFIKKIHDCRRLYAVLAHKKFAANQNINVFISNIFNYEEVSSLQTSFHYSSFLLYDDLSNAKEHITSLQNELAICRGELHGKQEQLQRAEECIKALQKDANYYHKQSLAYQQQYQELLERVNIQEKQLQETKHNSQILQNTRRIEHLETFIPLFQKLLDKLPDRKKK